MTGLFPLVLFVLVVCSPQTPRVSSSPPWQSKSHKDVKDEARFRELPPAVFAPGGRLYSVESVVDAAISKDDQSSNLVVAIHCENENAVVVVASSTKSPYLDKNATISPMQIKSPVRQLAPGLFGVTAGNAVDSLLLQERIQQLATTLREARDGGFQGVPDRLPPSVMARNLADFLQRPTQTQSAGRVLASFALILDRSQIWRVDPTGQFWRCRATAIGKASPQAEAFLNEHLDKDCSVNRAVSLARDCFKSVLDDGEDTGLECRLLRDPETSQTEWI